MAFPSSPNRIIQALEALSHESDGNIRQLLLQSSLKEMVKWFTLAARKIIQGHIHVPKQTQTYINKHQHEISQLADGTVDIDTKKKLILKPGGGGFLGGVLIRSLLRWGKGKKKKQLPRKTSQPRRKTTTRRKTKKSDKFVTIRRKRRTPTVRSPPNISPLTIRRERITPTVRSPPNISPVLSSHSVTPQHASIHSPVIGPAITPTTPVSSRTSTPKSGQYINVPGFQSPRSHLTTPSYQSKSSLTPNSFADSTGKSNSSKSNRSRLSSSSGHWSSSTTSSGSTPPVMRFSPLRGGLSRPAAMALAAIPPNLRPRHLFSPSNHSTWLGLKSVMS